MCDVQYGSSCDVAIATMQAVHYSGAFLAKVFINIRCDLCIHIMCAAVHTHEYF